MIIQGLIPINVIFSLKSPSLGVLKLQVHYIRKMTKYITLYCLDCQSQSCTSSSIVGRIILQSSYLLLSLAPNLWVVNCQDSWIFLKSLISNYPSFYFFTYIIFIIHHYNNDVNSIYYFPAKTF